MEEQNLGISYTAFSRAESEDRWCLVEKIPEDRLLYINDHPQMKNRHEEEQRLRTLSTETIHRYSYLTDDQKYVSILQEFDVLCNDGIITSS